jgi:hypothetical protein
MKKSIQFSFVFALGLAIALTSCNKAAKQEETTVAEVATPAPNTLTDEEKAAGWELLFDGATLNGWKRYNRDTIGPLWTVQDGAIVCDGSGFGEGSGDMGGSLMTTKTFGNFELSVEWKISPGGNSGILYHVVESPEYKYDYETGPEYQVLDDGGWPGGELTPAQKVGSNYDMFEAPETKKVMPVGEWNTSRIVYNNGRVEHYLNGEMTVEFDESSEEYTTRYQQSKWVEYPGWNKSKVGAISLQDHGAPVYFRSIKIRPL